MNYAARVLAAQQVNLFVGIRAHDGVDVGLERTYDLDHLARAEGVGRGDHQHTGACDVRLNQHDGLGGVTRHRQMPSGARSCSNSSRFCSATTNGMRCSRSDSPMRAPTRP